MRLPLNFLQSLKNFIISRCYKKASGRIIPDEISENELIVRGIFTPLYYSKTRKELKEGAFLPPPKKGDRDVSVLRAEYASDDFCKTHCFRIKINGQSFCGFATFLGKHIDELAIKHGLSQSIRLRFSPLQEDMRSLITERPVTTLHSGLPMHADIYYDNDFEPGKPQTKYRKFAKELAIKLAYYINDDYPESSQWLNEKLRWMATAS